MSEEKEIAFEEMIATLAELKKTRCLPGVEIVDCDDSNHFGSVVT